MLPDNPFMIGLSCAAATSTITDARSQPNFLPLKSLALIASVASTGPTGPIAPVVRPCTEDTTAKLRLEAAKQAQAQQAATATGSTEEPAAVVSISRQGAEQATAQSASTQAAAATAAAADSTPRSNKPALAYEAADTEQDGKISAFEQQSNDFRHPTVLKADTELAATTTAPKDEPTSAAGKSTGAPGTLVRNESPSSSAASPSLPATACP